MLASFRRVLPLVLFLRICPLLALDTKGGSVNFSSISWATSIHVDQLQSHPPGEEAEFDDSDADGGFASLDSMLQWAIGHSDPDTLKGAARAVQNLSATELKVRQAAIMELMESLRRPSDADLMMIAIRDLKNASCSFDDRQRALKELLELVEPIYNSNDLHKLGGLVVVVRELDRPEQELRILAAWVLGKASQNNELVQRQLLELDVIPRLMEMVRSRSTEEAVKALYALSAVVRNHPMGQERFYLLDGQSLLEDLMRDTGADVRLHRKSLFLVADLAEQQKEFFDVLSKYEPSKSYLRAVVSLLNTDDLDTQEKALMAIHSLGVTTDTVYNLLKQECDVQSVLLKLQLELDTLWQSDSNNDFVRDLQLLCQKVRSIFSDGRDGNTSMQ